ncbi:MAG: 4-alpha-glucanotransferase [Clostridiales Family XIII bacterium]|jgi:4-alpha-glucanotransferase|nr:4-alpha-glucanotransferase [Clostridiales Family XIII bacterium]
MAASNCARRAGILLPVTALPSAGGIGTLGASAYEFVDFLAAAGQSIWQALPIGPVGFGHSPYQASSAFAGNPWLIDIEGLVRDGLVTKREASAFFAAGVGRGGGRVSADVNVNADVNARAGGRAGAAAYEFQRKYKEPLLLAAARRLDGRGAAYRKFLKESGDWAEAFALYSAAAAGLGGAPLASWPKRLRNPAAAVLTELREMYAEEIECTKRIQYLFFSQWKNLKSYANLKGVGIVGDLPLYVSADSADFWLHRPVFDVGRDGLPAAVGGVPPDDFSEDGQVWNNPVFAWGRHKKEVFDWWRLRLLQASRLYDGVRIDHFRGFSEYFAIPVSAAGVRVSGAAGGSGAKYEGSAGAKCARGAAASSGVWRPGPGKAFIDFTRSHFPGLWIIAENLGSLTEEAEDLLCYSGFPGMKVLQFAFSGDSDNRYLPHNIEENCVVYTGTHDNNTVKGWARELSQGQADFALRYLGLSRRLELPSALIRAALASRADTAIIPMQDWLGLGAASRVNTPGTIGGRNWKWRLAEGTLTEGLAERIRACTKELYGR